MRNEDKARAGSAIHAGYEADRRAVEQNVIDKIDKLFKLAAKAGTEHEATAAMNKAQELMEAHNLSEACITEGASSAKAAKRTDEKHAGGLYVYQRNLWQALAELNFCFYWNLYERDPTRVSRYWARKLGTATAREWGYTAKVFRHRLVGRAVNVAAALAMAKYIEDTIERITKERLEQRNADKAEQYRSSYGSDVPKGYEDQLWGEWAVKYREGIADTVIDKIYKRRRQIISEQKGQQFTAPTEGRDKAQTGTALSLMDIQEQETAANYDFLHGEGAYAKLLEHRARAAARAAERDAERAAWAEANPEEAKAEEEARRKRTRRTSWNAGMSSKRDKTDHGAYWDGRDAGEKVSIDRQAGSSGVAGLLK